MKKFTRKHYNKKLVAFGLSAFMGVGLISTGFAAWVISKDAEEKPEGNVNVAVITDSSVKINLDAPATYDDLTKVWTFNDDFSFDAPKDDVSGRIRYSGPEDGGEDLSITFSGYLSGNAGVAYDLTAQVVLPEGVAAALDQGYIAWAPNSDHEVVEYDQVTEVTVDSEGKFSVTIAFVWGEKFSGVNPSVYYDTTGSTVSDEQMSTELAAFHDVISVGLTETPAEGNVKNSYSGKFTVTLSATPAVVDNNPVTGE